MTPENTFDLFDVLSAIEQCAATLNGGDIGSASAQLASVQQTLIDEVYDKGRRFTYADRTNDDLLASCQALLGCVTLDSDMEEDFEDEIRQARLAIGRASEMELKARPI